MKVYLLYRYIAVICHQRHQHRWCTFFQLAYFFSTENAKGTTLNMPCHAILINKYAKQKQKVHQSKQQICHLKDYANKNTKYAISIKRVCQTKHKVRHLSQKNTPTKTSSTPFQSKEYANQNTKYQISKEYAHVNFISQY